MPGNLLSKNFQKAAEAFITTLVAGVVSGAATEAAKATGVEISLEVQSGLIMTGMLVISGVINGVRNAVKHWGGKKE